jgi:hypothetical protein
LLRMLPSLSARPRSVRARIRACVHVSVRLCV